MKAYVLEEIGKLIYKEVEMPVLKSGEVLVEVKAAGICGSDIPRIFESGTYRFPLIPGHEFSGTVVEARDPSDQKWVGKNVGIFPLIPCKECPSCRKREYEMCRSYDYLGSRCDGGFAEYVAVPAWNLIALPDEMSLKEAAMLEPATVALHAVRKLDLIKTGSAALLGLGPIGNIITQWMAGFGVKQVLAVGRRQEFGDVMKKTADAGYQYANDRDVQVPQWIKEQTGGEGADILIDCIGTSQSLENCLESAACGGQVLILGNPRDSIFLSQKAYWQIHRKQLTVRGTWNSTFTHEEEDDWHTTIRACCEGRLNLKALITHELPFDGLEQGLSIMTEKSEYRNKILVTREGSARQ